MPFDLRPFDPESDLAALAELLSQVESEPVTEAMLRNREARRPPGELRLRLMARAAGGQPGGFGSAARRTEKADTFRLDVVVAQGSRGAGLGAALYEAVDRFARAHGAVTLGARVRDNDPVALGFAQRRDFRIDRHTFESVLELERFDPAPFAATVARVAAGGIRFFTFADTDESVEDRRRVWELNCAAARDNPGNGPDWDWPFEQFCRDVFEGHWFRPEGQILASDGDRWVGLAALGEPRPGAITNAFTGVLREYRGRGIAQALKLLGIEFARRRGARYLRTHNDSQNAPMLAINRKLGYQPEPGYYHLVLVF